MPMTWPVCRTMDLQTEKRFENRRADRNSDSLAEVIYLPGVKPLADKDDELVQEIREIALKALERRDLSRREVAEKLIGFDEGLVEEQVSWLERLGYVDDFRVAEALVSRLLRRKVVGIAIIRQQLVARKLSPESIDGALSSVDVDSQRELALRFAAAKLERESGQDRQVLVRRLTGQLLRRGFSSSTVSWAINAATNGGADFEES